MANLIQQLEIRYTPVFVLAIYKGDHDGQHYVESAKVNAKGKPGAFHPLTEKEADMLANKMAASHNDKSVLEPQGVLAENVLYLKPGAGGYAIWHTPARKVPLLMEKYEGLSNGEAFVPPMLWKAEREHLKVFALKSSKRPQTDTPLYYAPFPNIDEAGAVCMGNVNILSADPTCLEEFISAWEQYFFNSYFTEMNGRDLTNSDLSSIWKSLLGTDKPFPVRELKKSYVTIKSIL